MLKVVGRECLNHSLPLFSRCVSGLMSPKGRKQKGIHCKSLSTGEACIFKTNTFKKVCSIYTSLVEKSKTAFRSPNKVAGMKKQRRHPKKVDACLSACFEISDYVMNTTTKCACHQFDPRPQGAEQNEKIFALGRILGVEVTIPALAVRCSDGNLDHHGQDSTPDTPSACEQAMTFGFPYDWVVGQDGGQRPTEWPAPVLATVRPDADSVTAMAVIENRLADRPIDRDLIAAVGTFDRFGPSAGKPDARVNAIARKAADFKLPLEERVAWVADLLAGTNKSEEIAALVAAHDSELADARKASGLTLHADGRIACVVSTHRFGTTLGYESASVVVAMNPSMPVDPKDSSKGTYRKFTVCRYDSHIPCDLPAALKELQALEEGWGGRGDIFGSPQGISSTLTVEQVIEVVSRHLK